MDKPTLGFLGTGVVATALCQSLGRAGYRIAAVHGRDSHRARELALSLDGARAAATRQEVADESDLVVLAVSDDAIAAVADSISWRQGGAVVHCNGAASLALLQTAQRAGADVGVFHPLQSFASAEQALRLIPGSAFRVEASSDRLRGWLTNMAVSLGGRPLALSADPALYHVSAVLASNYLVTLLDLAAGLWPELGSTREDGLSALLPLVRGTIENIERLGIPSALTGPIARGDVGTVARHLDVLREVAPHALPVYKELALRAIQVALRKGTIDRERAGRLEIVLGDRPGGAPTCGDARAPRGQGGTGCGSRRPTSAS